MLLTLANDSVNMVVSIANVIVGKGGKLMRIDRVKFVSEITRQDITLLELAKKSGVTRVTLSNIKCGKSCRDDIGHKVAKALNVNVKDLLED